jgi:hypothetical protein
VHRPTCALPEIEHSIGPVRQGVLDHLLGFEGPMGVVSFGRGMVAFITRQFLYLPPPQRRSQPPSGHRHRVLVRPVI